MSIDTGSAQVFFLSFGQFRSELLNPAVNRESIHTDITLSQQIHNVLIRQRIPQILPHSTKDDLTRKTVMLERRFAWHAEPQKPKRGRHHRLMQQSRKADLAIWRNLVF
ncbi:hypothetical protein ROLI_045520 (plasmid) [Roseobacter fucihabitans]|uniref:Uncharacterized protein n=1 Tax=Roseobacter fucihabitans TaxID=1537242 RepID=A0ABZ2C1G5_9RHOB|nr:hypothetical protein [Roseobacter litoralis]